MPVHTGIADMVKAKSNASRGLLVAEVSWDAIAPALAGGAVAVLPVGAAAKEHGRHLPMNADWRLAEWLAQRLAERQPVAVWPTLGYGYYPAFTQYPGSVSLGAATFRALVEEIAKSIFESGAMSLVIVNTGVSTVAPLETLRAAADEPGRIALAHVWQGAGLRAAVDVVREEVRGGHAGELETSVLLAIAPEQVDMSRARPWLPPSLELPGEFTHCDPAHPQYSPDGIYGDPTRATRAKGELLLAAMLADVEKTIGRVSRAERP
jgi:creatinine amidohydrolase